MSELVERDVFRPADEFESADYGIVFGCDFHTEMDFRIRGAIKLVSQGKLGTLILSGGATGKSGLTEAEAMKATAKKAGVAPDKLLLENESRTTQQNAWYCAKLIQTRNDDLPSCSVALITSDWHMSRAWMMAKQHFPPMIRLHCCPQRTTCSVDVWHETIQCACLIRSELQRVKHAMQRGYPDPRV